MAVTNAGSTSLTFTNTPIGIQVTKITDNSGDFASIANSTYFYNKADGLVYFKNSGGTILEIFSAGGLTKFTEAENTSAPNGTVYVDSLTAAGSTTNVDVAIVPKGTGAFMLDIPDNASTGGNKRGTNAVDLQTNRSSATQVASGPNSFAAGAGNIASGNSSTALGGLTTASGIAAFSAGNGGTAGNYATSLGYYTTASGQSSITAGQSTVASGNYSQSFGEQSVASGDRSFAGGLNAISDGSVTFSFGWYTRTFGLDNRVVFGRAVTTAGDCQQSKFFLAKNTTNNTASTLTVGGGAAGAANQVILSNQSAYRFKGTIIGKQQGSVNAAVWDIDGFIVRGANAAATTLNVSNVTLVQNTPAWGTPTLAADTTNGGLQVQVTGAASTNIQWTAVIETTEVIYA